MKIYFAADHAGFELKNMLIAYVINELNIESVDCGAFELDTNDDYPTYIREAAQHVSKDPLNTRAIILGGSGQGEAIAANRHTNVRACVYYGGTLDIITLSREHNDANVLALGARFLSESEAKDAVQIWLNTSFSHDERHIRRIQMLE